MQLEIRGYHLPGRSWAGDGTPRDNVHVGVQVRSDPAELVAGDADRAQWLIDVEVRQTDGGTDFAGPAVHGKRSERFVYLTWGNVDGDSFAMFRRAKLMLDSIDEALLSEAEHDGRRLVAKVDLTDACGDPRCARLRAPALALSVE